MTHHKFRFGLKGNFKVLLCRIFGHRINDKPNHHRCGRCGLAYEECYHPDDWHGKSGTNPYLSRLLRETIMRTQIAMPLDELDLKWWNEGTDHKQIKGDFFFDIANFLGVDEYEMPDKQIHDLTNNR